MGINQLFILLHLGNDIKERYSYLLYKLSFLKMSINGIKSFRTFLLLSLIFCILTCIITDYQSIDFVIMAKKVIPNCPIHQIIFS